MSSTAIRGVYSDFKIIKTRSAAQIVIEIPIETADRFIAMFGVPQPAKERWVAVALLYDKWTGDNGKEEEPPEERGDGPWSIRALSVLVEQQRFRDFICSMHLPYANRLKKETILDAVKEYVGIKSRREFRTNPEAVDIFVNLYKKYLEYTKESVDDTENDDTIVIKNDGV